MHPVAAAIATLIIFFAPGLLWVAAFRGGKAKPRVELSLAEQAFLTLACSIVVSGWVGLLLAELGLFSPGRVATVVAILVVATALGARRQLSLRAGRAHLDEVVALVCLCGFALAVYFPPFEYFLGGKDPGVYVNTGFHVARHGNLTWIDPLILDVPPGERGLFFREDVELPPWSQPRFLGYHMESPETGRIVPQGLHLYPVWMGLAAGLYQMKAGLYATPFFALLAVAGFFLAIRRLFGAQVALWAAGFATVFQIQVWFARFPNTEIVLQFLYVTGLLTFYFMQEKRSSLAGALAGAAFGSTLLVRVDSILFLIPLGIYFGWLRLERRLGRPEVGFLSVFALFATHAVLHARLVAWPYVANILGRHYWRWVGENLVLIALAVVVVFLLVDRLAPRFAVRSLQVASSQKIRAAGAATLFLLAAYTYFIRPHWHGARTAPHDAEAFLRMGWYLYPLGLALVLAGAMILVTRWERRWSLFLLAGLTFSLFFFYKVRVSNDHFFCMRRFIPVILPGFFTAMAVFLVNIKDTGGKLGRWVSSGIGVVVLSVYCVDGRPLWTHNEFAGSHDFVEYLGRHIGDRDVVIFPRREGLHLLELPLVELEGRQVLEFYTLKPDRKMLEELIRSWRDRYGDIYFITNYKISLSGLFTRHVRDFWLPSEKYEYTYIRPPSRSEPFHLRFTLSKAVDLDELADRLPRVSRVDVGTNDDSFVSWFHEAELEDGVSYRWSKRTSSIFLPALGPESSELVLRLAGPNDERVPARTVVLAINGQPLGSFTMGTSFETFRLPLPAEATGNLVDEHPIVTLETETWRPSSSIPDSKDIRDLGVKVDWIETN